MRVGRRGAGVAGDAITVGSAATFAETEDQARTAVADVGVFRASSTPAVFPEAERVRLATALVARAAAH